MRPEFFARVRAGSSSVSTPRPLVAQLGPAIDVRTLLEPERAALLELLVGLPPSNWAAATVCPGWAVRDVVAHLVHDDLRRLSRTRDGYGHGPAPQIDEPLASFLNRANQRWVSEVTFLSPAVMVDLLACTGPLLHAMWAGADLDALGEGVSWADVDPAPVWLDLAREYTESWTHHQQIRDAVRQPGLLEPAFLDPVLDTFLRALPATYAGVHAPDGTVVAVGVDDGRLTWSLQRIPAGWTLQAERSAYPTASITMPADTLWRLATGGITTVDAATHARIDGDHQLASHALGITSVIR